MKYMFYNIRKEVNPYIFKIFYNIHEDDVVFNIDECDYIICDSYVNIKRYIDSLYKNSKTIVQKFLLYTLEPRHDFNRQNILYYRGIIIYVLNCYNNKSLHKFSYINNIDIEKLKNSDENNLINIYTDNIKNKFNKELYNNTKIKSIMVASLIEKYIKQNVINDLMKIRKEVGYYGYNNRKMDLVGTNWLKNISNSRTNTKWQIKKQEMIYRYYFNICLENTNIDNYITEKIWDSIFCGCVPIYYGNNSVYEIFSEDSFIDISKFKNAEELFIFIDNMSYEEYYRRIVQCLKDIYLIFKKNPNIKKEEDDILRVKFYNIIHNKL